MNNANDFDVDQFIEDMLAEDSDSPPEQSPEEYSRLAREHMESEENFNRGAGITSPYDPRWITC